MFFYVCFLLGNYSESGFYMPTFRNTLFHLHRQVDVSRMKLVYSYSDWIKKVQVLGRRGEHLKKRQLKDLVEEGQSVILYAFFWVITRRLDFICRTFGTLCLFHLHRQVDMSRMKLVYSYSD